VRRVHGRDFGRWRGRSNGSRRIGCDSLIDVLKVDEKRWKQPYGIAADGPPDLRLAEFAELGLINCIDLGDAIMSDLSVDVGGVGWWVADLPPSERVLISDHLLGCIRAVSSNIFEACAALLAYREADAEFVAYLQRGLRSNGRYQMPPPRGPYDDLLAIRADANIANVARALGSALDCLGAAIVGVAGLPTSIVRADLGASQKELGRAARREPRGQWATLASQVETSIERAGPAGWLLWLMDLRNMLVHRGRRVSTISSSVTAASPGRPATLTAVRLLPVSPALTEIEAWVGDGGYCMSLLSEPAEATLAGTIGSAAKTVDAVCAALLDVWLVRRADPELIPQPMKQWTVPKRQDGPRFTGYQPDLDLSSNVSSIGASDEAAYRLRAAGMIKVGLR